MYEETIFHLVQIVAVLLVCGASLSIYSVAFSRQFGRSFGQMETWQKIALTAGLFFVPFVASLQLWMRFHDVFPKLSNTILASGCVIFLSFFPFIWKAAKISNIKENREKEREQKRGKGLLVCLAVITALDGIAVLLFLFSKEIKIFYLLNAISLTLALAIIAYYTKRGKLKQKG